MAVKMGIVQTAIMNFMINFVTSETFRDVPMQKNRHYFCGSADHFNRLNHGYDK